MTQPTPKLGARAGQYLTFSLGAETYGLEILGVREIVGLMPITALPRTPEYIEGVVNLRGKIIPVIDLRLRFGLQRAERTPESCIIVVDLGGTETGLIVDRVSEVLDVAGDDVEDTPSLGASVETRYIRGIAKTGEKVTILLETQEVVADAEVAAALEAV